MTGPHREQWFHYYRWVFAVHTAMELIDAAPRPTRLLNVPTWAETFGLTRLDNPQPNTIALLGPAPDAFDRDYAMATDLTKPVIVAHLLINGVEPALLLIDGTHRLYRAWREGVPQLPAYVLTVAESRQVQQDLRLGPGRTRRARPR
ncbi:hypothetical protein F4553_005326 [Allocatelliglobosispora scoriae]|uniref:ParB/Sulfiredoxin domain-containing protein n=1 Tax=Allocatelliglobosispora scoriae TaxID=643052 RepID=A0A841BSB4_9ACTN|nr:hypothetical protein [Allocatelliglobosispora scoriae]MBB5871947.1 hypothetical protein [Allocatelliglobosispora scoriae]